MKIHTFKTSALAIFTGIIFTACSQNANFKTVKPAEFQKLINDKNTILVDVRTPEEYSEGKIVNAINIDYTSGNFEKEAIKLDKSKTILVYCHSGRRSAGAANILSQKGYKVINLEGGIINWTAQGLPINK
jgi:rhodanese-related sulfurtransferase